MLQQGLVVLSQNDVDAPALPAICSVSKEESWDDGGYSLAVAAAAAGRLAIDRPYFVDNPPIDWVVGKCNRNAAAGILTQLGNEQNLPLEGWEGGLEAWWQFEAAVLAAVDRPEMVLAMPPSPGVAGWQDWLSSDGPQACHAYGTLEQMKQTVAEVLTECSGDVYITECNFGAGNSVDVDAWTTDSFWPFLDWCATQPRIKAVCYFAWVWHGAPSLPTPVDAKGTSVVDALTEWTPPAGGGANGDIVLGVPTEDAPASPANYTRGPRERTRGVVVHTTRGGTASAADDYSATKHWFANPQAQVSAHLVVGPDRVARCVHDQDIAWHARTANAEWLGIEIAQPTMSSPISDFQYQAAAEACRLWADKYDFPRERVLSETAYGLLGHEDSESGRADQKTDPGVPPAGVFDWSRFVLACRQASAFDVDAVRDEVWQLAETLEQNGWPWFGQNLKSAVAQSKGDQ